MKKMFTSSILFLSLCISHYSQAEDSFYANEAVASIDNPEEYMNQIALLSSIEEKTQDSAYSQRIIEIDIENRQIVLEDYSKCTIGWWYSDIILDWEIGDRIAVSYFRKALNPIGLQNLDKQSLAWGIIYNWDKAKHESADFVVEVIYPVNSDFSSVITLKSGFQFGIPSLWLLTPTYEVGDPVFIFQNNDIYLIENLFPDKTGVILSSATLVKAGNPNWRDAQPQ